jgi:hypothetical protein
MKVVMIVVQRDLNDQMVDNFLNRCEKLNGLDGRERQRTDALYEGK